MSVKPSPCLSPVSGCSPLDSIYQSETELLCEDYLDQNVWNRIFPQFHFIQLICQTDNSLVWEGFQKVAQRRLALKITQKIQKGSSVVLHQERQKTFVEQNQYKYMVKVFEIKETGLYRLTVMEYYPWSLADMLTHYTKSSNKRYTASHLNFISYAFNGMLKAVEALHQLGYVHRDLKLDNFMVDTNLNICLNDFELVTKELVIDPSLSGTLEYMAPERLSNKRMKEPITKGVDVWSLGIILYQLFTGETPYSGQSSEQILDEIYEDYFKAKLIPQQAMGLIKQMLQIKADRRISLLQIKKSSFLQAEINLNMVKDIVGL